MRNYWVILLLTFVFANLHGQDISQTVRGKVVDKETKQPLFGAVVTIIGSWEGIKGTSTNDEGEFTIANVPVGRINIRVNLIGYQQQEMNGLILSSGKELVLNFDLEESVSDLKEVEIVANTEGASNNQMATLSAKSFNVEQTERFAGSRGDPARMASNYAGVQGSDDSRNDIVVRGNSPFGVIYRIEGIESPNPNHFAVAGTAGGPVSILNNKVLANSDFFTGAFPAEYGNSIAGVFDIRLRNGNNQKHEFTGQLGFLGTEVTAEGPLGKSGASYLLNYRYSTLKVFESFNFKIGTAAVPNYQDGAFKLNFPTKKGNISVFGIGGISNIDIVISTRTEQQDEIYGDKDRDQYFGSKLGLGGVSWTTRYSDKTYAKLTVAVSGTSVYAHHDKVYFDTQYRLDSLKPILGYNFLQGKQMLSYVVNHKINSKQSIRAGINLDRLNVNLTDSILDNVSQLFITREDAVNATFLVQPFIQYKFKFTENTTLNAGVHGQYFALNGSSAVEPRLGVQHELTARTRIGAAYGYHSQLQPLYIYYHQFADATGMVAQHNKDLGFTRSHHFVTNYQYSLGKGMRFTTEAYFQYLTNVPVETVSSSFSLINQGTGFTRIFPNPLANKGVGRNYGLEVTLERSYNKSFYFMISAAVFKSEAQGSDQIWRSTDFDTRFAANFLIGKEWKVTTKSALGLGSKTTIAGGRRFGPADLVASSQKGEIVYVDATRNSLQFRDYFRTDLKVNYRMNRQKVAHEIGLDLVNILGTKNLLTLTYAPNPAKPADNPIKQEYQLGFLPLFYYKIDF